MKSKFFVYIAVIYSSINLFAHTLINDTLVVRSILDENSLQHIPVDSVANFGNSNRVTFLSLSRLSIKTIPPILGELDGLYNLVISFNPELTKIPESIGQLKNLVFPDRQQLHLRSAGGAYPHQNGRCSTSHLFGHPAHLSPPGSVRVPTATGQVRNCPPMESKGD